MICLRFAIDQLLGNGRVSNRWNHLGAPDRGRFMLAMLNKSRLGAGLGNWQASRWEAGERGVKSALVCGAGGFIGSHLVRRLVSEGFWVRGVDLKYPEFSETGAHDFVVADLREPGNCRAVIDRRFDEVYQLAADMGGAGFIFTGENDADIMHNSATINLNVLEACMRRNVKNVFYSSSACMYPAHNQEDPNAPVTREDSAYPANPDWNTAGKSCSPSGSIWRLIATMACTAVSHATTTSLALKEHGPVAGKRRLPPSAARSPRPMMALRSKFGAMGYRRVHFFTSTNVLREACG